ncbi:MAG: NADH-quinone oxidoreductase subunit M, partial [Coriobacteriia bacterium]|nr:NADH-quinone oxidoreductase subunit M [Coriobacteriia bacterium]
VAALLFLLVGALHDRTHTREISAFGGLGQTLPRWAGVFVFASLASLGLPGLSGFPGEFAAVAGSFVRWGWPIALAGVGVVGAGVYALHAVRGVVQGEPAAAEEGAAPLPDLGVRELLAVAPLAVLIVLLGLWPRLVTDVAGPAVDVLAAALGGWL